MQGRVSLIPEQKLPFCGAIGRVKGSIPTLASPGYFALCRWSVSNRLGNGEKSRKSLMCRWSDSNRHAFLRAQDFKSCVSAISPHRRASRGHDSWTNNHEAEGFVIDVRPRSTRAKPISIPTKNAFAKAPSSGRVRGLCMPNGIFHTQ